MNTSPLNIIHYQDLPIGGFAGIVEKQMVISPQFWKGAEQREGISHGLGDLIYLARGYFKPNDGAPIHPHNDVDIVTVVLSGSVEHKGTLGDGTIVEAPGVQVQRAGLGMQHSEFSRSDTKSDFIQIWFLPPENGLKPAYQNFDLKKGELTTVLGGKHDETFHNTMMTQVGFIAKDQRIQVHQPFVAVMTQGSAIANGVLVSEGDLIEGESLEISSDDEFGLVLIQAAQSV